MTNYNKLKEKQEAEIQQDLNNAKFGMICSNEDTFKRYVFEKMDRFRQETAEYERKRIKKIVKKVNKVNESNGRYNACYEILEKLNNLK